MGLLTLSIHVDAPPERVFAAATDIPRAAERIRGITGIRMQTDGPVGVGTVWRETRVMFGKEHTETLEITAFDPPRSYSVGCDSCGVLWDSRFEFVPENGGTRVDLVMRSTPRTLWARVMGAVTTPLFRKALMRCIAEDLEDIKRHAEGAAPEPAPA